jgi:YebC/PmpR family DNA-binding regulatory protein
VSGHSKWSSIKHKKGAADAKRGREFTKLSRALTVAVREGGPDPGTNLALQNAVEKARQASMPKDNIERAIARASGEGADAAAYETVTYEGYGPGGIAVYVEALTDNRNRTAGELRSAFAKAGGALGETNSVAFQFERKGVIRYPAGAATADAMLEAAIEAGAEDAESDAEEHEVTTSVEDFFTVRDALEGRFGTADSAKLEWLPSTTVDLDEDRARDVLKLVDVLDDNDDVQNVYANFEVSEAVMQRLSAA